MIRFTQTASVGLLLGGLVVGCSGGGGPNLPHLSNPPAAKTTPSSPPTNEEEFPIPPVALASSGRSDAAQIATNFEKYRLHYSDATYGDLTRELGIKNLVDRRLSFDPTRIEYFDRIDHELQLTAEERKVYRQQGMVSVDHGQRYSMASVYYAIYARDLPVLVTTDSILHALHRSYDAVLEELERKVFLPVIDEVLKATHDKLDELKPRLASEPLLHSAEDVDLYLSVARSLLNGAGTSEQPHSGIVTPRVAPVEDVRRLLANIASLEMQRVDDATALYGGFRPIDYSQFRPRGHYTKRESLQRYFRAMMWLGRADTGFLLTPTSGSAIHETREARSAALLTAVLARSGKLSEMHRVSTIVNALVGQADNVQLADMQNALSRIGVTKLEHLAGESVMGELLQELSALGPQRIRSQVLLAGDSAEPAAVPQSFQVFGQRFVIDSYVLSQVVYDSIVFQSQEQKRYMPSGFDVMAALGNDEAVRLLEPEVNRHQYAANLLAARRTVDELPSEAWTGDVHQLWLDALRTLNDLPEGLVPEAMRRKVWRRKQLQTQLASWAELRRDNVLYAKQSYTSAALCDYPAGFVEPYPVFYEKIQALAERMLQVLESDELRSNDPRAQAAMQNQRTFFRRFADTMKMLAHLARKELNGQPFTLDEEFFLKRSVDVRGGGSGPPTYSGWYPKLIYGDEPHLWEPTIADIHTDAHFQRFLQAGVGDVNFLIVAIDNAGDRRAYVGPVYSYYEFAQPTGKRMTDQEWQALIEQGKTPQRPPFTSEFRADPVTRHLARSSTKPLDPRIKHAKELIDRSQNANPEEKARIEAEAKRLQRESLEEPIPLP